MRLFLALFVMIYLIGVGVVLSPEIRAKWDHATASELATSIVKALPDAFAWPATLFQETPRSDRA
jgi:hypothetical protein